MGAASMVVAMVEKVVVVRGPTGEVLPGVAVSVVVVAPTHCIHLRSRLHFCDSESLSTLDHYRVCQMEHRHTLSSDTCDLDPSVRGQRYIQRCRRSNVSLYMKDSEHSVTVCSA